jgi:hypothetical protein
MILDIILFTLAGTFAAWWATMIMTPTRYSNPLFFYLIAIIAAIILGILTPEFGIFIVPFVFIGSLLMAFFGALFFLWMIGLIFILISSMEQEQGKKYQKA